MQMALIGIFGVIGVVSRYWSENWLSQNFTSEYPFATLLINCFGSFLIGVLFVVGFQRALISREISMGISVGLLGGFTTFSAFSLQALQLIQRQQYGVALAYLISSPVLGVFFAFCGTLAGEYLGNPK